MNHKYRTRTAFTLLELLIVIAIIAILAALLLGSMGKIQSNAQQVQSLSNLRQFGAALNLSLGDRNNNLPWEGQPITIASRTAWYNVLPPYMNELPMSKMTPTTYPRAGQKSVWINPAVPTWENNQFKYQFLFCYAMNYYLSTGAIPMLNVARIAKPSATVFLSETIDNYANSNPAYIKALFLKGDILKPDGTWTPQADAGANFLFCDGHVALKKRSEFDSKFGANSLKSPPDPNFTFVPYTGAAQQ
jgi:prepilin-type N-terminal cleavage/methylation domain-containing protein/prepilin-type processing-associated H-X9-DG protein